MRDIKSPVYVDDNLLRELARRADQVGLDRDAFIEITLRRYTADRQLLDTMAEVGDRARLGEDEALDLVYRERDAMRAERRAGES